MTMSDSGKRLKITTLGHFAVVNGSSCISHSCGRSRKIWDLFKLLLVHHDRVLMPESIVEQLWPEKPYDDARGAVRTLVHRLRSVLGEDMDYIKFTQGGYTFSLYHDVWLDIHVFENTCRQARQLAKQGLMPEAVHLYKQGLSLYQGDLLPECPYSDWLLPHRGHYHSLYVQAVAELAVLLDEQHSYAELEEEVTRALMVDYYEETLHLILLQTLLREGKFTQAKWHYEKVTSVFYREMGLKPSAAMKGLLRLILGQETENNRAAAEHVPILDAVPCQEESRGALLCEREVFRVICSLESRRAERTGSTGQVAVLAVTQAHISDSLLGEKGDEGHVLEKLLRAVLRKGDVLCRDGLHQFFVLLPATTYEQAQSIIRRVEDAAKERGLLLRRRLQPLSAS
ncbi:MAG: winged helix-turn-helix domain-containing protein [Firmicutes bacterium]|nr:winged helix-turn-helix domain-containing protein [Dethiobacter sp.]MBS3888211.1 winged helix-turn-helix domain-containing protein [Bacillota bacterium]